MSNLSPEEYSDDIVPHQIVGGQSVLTAGGMARRGMPVFVPATSGELEGRTLLSTLTVVNGHESGAGSLPQEVALAKSGDTIAFSPSLAGHTTDLHIARQL